MNNLKYIMAHLEEWTDGNDPDYYVLRKRYLSVLSQIRIIPRARVALRGRTLFG